MEALKQKMTAPYASVGADAGQPSENNFNKSIAENSSDDNAEDKSLDLIELYRKKTSAPGALHTVSMSDLYDQVFPGRPPIIDGLLYPGAYIFSGAPKIGKSFLTLQLAYHVSAGIPLWGYTVHKGTVLYLALEDTYSRLQKRLYQLFDTDVVEDLHFAINADKLGGGLEEQMEKFVNQHRTTSLIIIDTMQKIRDSDSDKYDYGKDYKVIERLKQFADAHGICVLVVHHTRKQEADDVYDKILGSNGLLGAVDGAFVLQKEKRIGNAAVLYYTSRDQQDQQLYLKRDQEHLLWQLERTETELSKEPPDPVLEAIATLLTPEQPIWSGSPTELVSSLGLDISARSLSMRLNVRASVMLYEYNIQYEKERVHAGRRITLRRLNPHV